jgi:hypothetical protein
MRDLEVLPCMTCLARMTLPPNASPMAWWPRHTPRIGFAGEVLEQATEMPACAGFRAGRDADVVGFSASISSIVISSLR